jgi:group II intron reverse transcriptase/maturase
MSQAKPFEISKHAVFDAWRQVKANRGAHGVDEQTITEFEGNLKSNLYRLWNRLSSGSYFPPPIRGVEIPKKDGKIRQLGVPTVADRIAQTVVRNRFETLVEPHFHPDSYAYRKGKSAIDAIRVTRQRCWKYSWVLEFDVQGAFDNIDHALMLKAVRHHTQCRWTLLYIERWLKAPLVRNDGSTVERDKGTPQGGVVSPLLFNLYLHYTFDLWMKRHFPHIPFARYADDGLLHCNSQEEAAHLQDAVGKRLRNCGLDLHPKKTKIVYCRDANRRGKYPNIQFEFLGYVFRGRLAKSRNGKYFNSFSPAVSRTSAKHIRQRMSQWNIGRWTNAELEDIARKSNASLRGWWNYFGVFCPSSLKRVMAHLNQILVRWAVRKYKRFKGSKRKARKWLRGISEREPNLLYHWQLGILPAVEQ